VRRDFFFLSKKMICGSAIFAVLPGFHPQ